MAEWRNDGMAEWRNGGMAEWRMEGGWNGYMEEGIVLMIIESQIKMPYLSKVASTNKHMVMRSTQSRFEFLQNSLNKYAVI